MLISGVSVIPEHVGYRTTGRKNTIFTRFGYYRINVRRAQWWLELVLVSN